MRYHLATLLVCASVLSWAQSTTQGNSQNLQTCLSGIYPALCNHGLLTPSQTQQVHEAELRHNLNTCMTGMYPALCNHGLLTPSQTQQVHEAELRHNLNTCMTGMYPALCDHGLLTPSQAQQVHEAELRHNLNTCMTGMYPALCDHSLLTPNQAQQVHEAELRHQTASVAHPVVPDSNHTYQRTYRGTSGGDCQSGLSILSVGGDGKVIKLSDGSMWEVDDVDTVDTALWLPPSDVVVCNGKMINTDDNESAFVTLLRIGSATGSGLVGSTRDPGYPIEASANDETFVINGEVFKAKTYCFNFEKGDRVKFIEGSAFGACASAKMLNLRNGKVCDVWCE